MDQNQIIGANLRKLRDHNKLNQDHLGELIGVHRTEITHYEKGERAVPRKKLEFLLDYFGVEMNEILNENFEKNKINFTFSFRRKDQSSTDVNSMVDFIKMIKSYENMLEIKRKKTQS